MRPYLLILSLTLLVVRSFGQSPEPTRRTPSKPVVYSASSAWQKVTFKATTRLKPGGTSPTAQPEVNRPPVAATPTTRQPAPAGSDESRPEFANQKPITAVESPAKPGTEATVRPKADAAVAARSKPSTSPAEPVSRPPVPPVVDRSPTPSGETRSGETRSGETRSGETRSGETRSGETRSGETRSGVPERSPVPASTGRISMGRLNSSQPDVPPPASAPGESIARTTNSAASASGYRPAFTGDFVTNRNHWKAGNQGDYNYQIGFGKYNIRKRKANTQDVAFSYVPLPSEINQNIAETFTMKVDVVADSGRIPTGGLLFGVRDSLNFCAFTMNGKGEISIIRVANGEAFSDYMPGDFFAPGVPVDRNRNRLIIRRKGDALHFYINEREVRSSPYPFKMFAGNNVGIITSGYWTSFQKFSVILGL